LAMAPEIATEAPPSGAAAGRVTVQVVLVLEANVGAVHWRNDACAEPPPDAVNVIHVAAIWRVLPTETAPMIPAT
jgi:hypothetical protein